MTMATRTSRILHPIFETLYRFADKWSVLQLALCSRVFICIASIAFNLLIPDHDAHVLTFETCGPAAKSSVNGDIQATPCTLLDSVLSTFTRWDSAQFLDIASRMGDTDPGVKHAFDGYTTEASHAFLPMFPFTIRVLAQYVVAPLSAGTCVGNRALVVAAVLLSNLFFVIAASGIYKLTKHIVHYVVKGDGASIFGPMESLPKRVALAFCITPAGNVFFSMAYTESLFAALTFWGIYFLLIGVSTDNTDQRRLWIWRIPAIFLLSLATAVRSNGIVGAGFPLYFGCLEAWQLAAGFRRNHVLVQQLETQRAATSVAAAPPGLAKRVSASKQAAQTDNTSSSSSSSTPLSSEPQWAAAVAAVSCCALESIMVVAPFAAYLWYFERKFCSDRWPEWCLWAQFCPCIGDDGQVINTNGEDTDILQQLCLRPQWCSDASDESSVLSQSPYIPHSNMYSYIQGHYWNVGWFKYYELKQIPNFLLALPVIVFSGIAVHMFTLLAREWTLHNSWRMMLMKPLHSLPLIVLPFVVHETVLAVYGVLTINVQVLTRLLGASSPVIHWVLGYALLSPSSPRLAFCAMAWILAYNILGVILHCNALPWT